MHPDIVRTLRYVFELCDEGREGRIRKSDLIQLCQSSSTVAAFFRLSEQMRQSDRARSAVEASGADHKLSWEEFCELYLNLERGGSPRQLIGNCSLASPVGTYVAPGSVLGTPATATASAASPRSEVLGRSSEKLSVEGALLQMAAALDASGDRSPSHRLDQWRIHEEWRRQVEHSVVGWRGSLRLSAEVNQSIGAAAPAADSTRSMAPLAERLPPPTPLNASLSAKAKDGGFSSSTRSLSTRSPSSFEEWKTTRTEHEIRDKAEEAFRTKDYNTAVALYTLALAEDSQDREVLYSDRAVCLAMQGRYTEALQDAQSCVALKPEWALGYARLGLAQYCLGAYDDAAWSYRQGLELTPDNSALLDGLQQALAAAEVLGSASIDDCVLDVVL